MGNNQRARKMNDLLAICTQTFNSGPCLKDYLNNIVPQARAHSIPIHVFVTYSTDNTLQVLKEYQKQYPFLFFEYNKTNYGHDKSLISATKMATAKYVWVIGVRRRLTPFALEVVYEALRKFKPDLLIINTVERKQPAGRQAIECYHDLEEVFLKFCRYLGLLGSLILPAEAWKLPAINKYLEDEKLSAWIHLPTTFEYLASLASFTAVYLSSPLITSTGVFPSTWTKKTFETYERWANIVNALPKISIKNKRSIIEKQYRTTYQPKNLLLWRSLGVYDESVFKTYHQVFYRFTNPTVSRALAKLPVLPISMSYKAYTATRKVMRMFIHSYYPINPFNDMSLLK